MALIMQTNTPCQVYSFDPLSESTVHSTNE